MAFLIAELNDLDIMACDVVNIYLNALFWEKIWFAEGPEHRTEKTVNIVVMVRAFNGLNVSGAAWRKMFAEKLHYMDFVTTVVDPDVYRRQ